MATFIDEVKVYAKAGDGGGGMVAWRREKFVPQGGPAGGDGGNGGNVIFIADPNVRSLLDFKYKSHLRAKPGKGGGPKCMTGAGGDDEVVLLPVGTEVFDLDTGERLVDLTVPGEEVVVCAGGSGGHGNARFASATRQAPDFAKPGLPGEERNLRLSLKVLADVGLLGFPNAGKSTFLSAVSAARPKIADYPFTTLVPNLGVVRRDNGRDIVVADIPGLIEGAAEGAGLGVRFLKHLERVRVLLHLVEMPLEHMEQTPLERYRALRGELMSFNRELADLPEVVAVSKADVMAGDIFDDEGAAELRDALHEENRQVFALSSSTGEGVNELLDELAEWVHARVPHDTRPEKEPYDPLAKDKLR